MRRAGDTVRIDADSVLRALARMRLCSREYSAAAGRLGKGVPPMPPACLVSTELDLQRARARLLGLALRVELRAVIEEWRVSCLVDAGGGDVTTAAGHLGSDLSDQARRLVGDLQEQPGITLDPLAGEVHTVSGAADSLGQDWTTLELLGHLDPGYQAFHPLEAARTRQEALAMGLNTVAILSPEWAAVDPGGHRQATMRMAARTIDARDLARGDVARWGGHIGFGMLLGLLTRGLTEEESPAPPTPEDAAPDTAGAALKTGLDALDQVNREPTDGYDFRGSPVAPLLRKVEQSFRGRIGADPVTP
jgi:hypothetical protein